MSSKLRGSGAQLQDSKMKYYVIGYGSILAILFMIAGCSGEKAADRDRKWPEALSAHPRARDIKVHEHKRTTEIEYWFDEEFPAPSLLNWVTNHLTNNGWERIQGSFFNPQIQGVNDDWHKIIDSRESEEQFVHLRSIDWKDSENNILVYGFEYRYPRNSQPRLQNVHVHAIFFPLDLAKAQLEAGQKAIKTIDVNKGPN